MFSHSLSFLAGHSAENSEHNPTGCEERCSTSCSADSPESRSGRSSESNLPHSPKDGFLSYSESYPAYSPARYLESHLGSAHLLGN